MMMSDNSFLSSEPVHGFWETEGCRNTLGRGFACFSGIIQVPDTNGCTEGKQTLLTAHTHPLTPEPREFSSAVRKLSLEEPKVFAMTLYHPTLFSEPPAVTKRKRKTSSTFGGPSYTEEVLEGNHFSWEMISAGIVRGGTKQDTAVSRSPRKHPRHSGSSWRLRGTASLVTSYVCTSESPGRQIPPRTAEARASEFQIRCVHSGWILHFCQFLMGCYC